jgi:hypothetical protein
LSCKDCLVRHPPWWECEHFIYTYSHNTTGMLCIFIVLNTRQKLYNNAVINQLPAVPSDKLCAQFQAMNGGTVGSALNECLGQVPKGSLFTCTL